MTKTAEAVSYQVVKPFRFNGVDYNANDSFPSSVADARRLRQLLESRKLTLAEMKPGKPQPPSKPKPEAKPKPTLQPKATAKKPAKPKPERDEPLPVGPRRKNPHLFDEV